MPADVQEVLVPALPQDVANFAGRRTGSTSAGFATGRGEFCRPTYRTF
ncbi:hypothetical protein J9303_10280 [Bacillaceae bacterium Marseille-Q3522]|nr:hypothetical protein [Bacillaceae bacterium Marseille-Q3522]